MVAEWLGNIKEMPKTGPEQAKDEVVLDER